MVPCAPWAVDDGQPSWACSLDITPVLGPPAPTQHGTHLPKSCQSQHALLICPTLRPGSHRGSHTLLVPTSKAVCKRPGGTVEEFAGRGSSKRKKQNINSKRFLRVDEESLPVV